MLTQGKCKMVALSTLAVITLGTALPSAAAPSPAELRKILAAQDPTVPQGGAAAIVPAANTTPVATSPIVIGAPSRSALDALHDQAALLKAQLVVSKLQAEIQKTMNTSQEHSDGRHAPVPPPVVMTAAGPAPMPQVLAVMGAGGRLTATLLVPGGGEMTVSPGARLPGGWMLVRIVDGTVWARQKSAKRAEILPLAGGGPSPGGSSYGASFPAFPSAPTSGMPNMPYNPAMGGAALGNSTMPRGIR